MLQIWKYGSGISQKKLGRNENLYDEDVNDALDAMKYMKDLARGTAFIAPVVAKPEKLIEYSRCEDLKISQVASTGWIAAGDFYLFSAYYDQRMNSVFPGQHIVQLLGMHYRTFNETLYCTLRTPYTHTVVQAAVREIWQRAWDPRDHFYIPYLISCPVPRRLKEDPHLVVTVSTNRCIAEKTGVLKVHFNRRRTEDAKGKVAVCVKGLDYLEHKTYVNRFIEWMELQLLLGADSVTVYTYALTEKMFEVLDFYKKNRNLNHIGLTLPGESPNLPHIRSSFIWRNRQQKRRHELIPYNDCLYRHIDTHEYVLIIDTDEVVIPLKHSSWAEMIESELSEKLRDKATSISVTNVFKFPSSNNTASPFYMLENRRRSSTMQDKKDYGKSFVKTTNVATNHLLGSRSGNQAALQRKMSHRIEKGMSSTREKYGRGHLARSVGG
ncbi:hypothetical protein QR680_012174 [Steinernema hermaphroditum]|uniref:Glycosyltransferase family 92 protein n=1 Tax=Steinernema hermaphroditum TaxID=289476 RepID=A0AA39I3N7_9BILA|nr:hypothetical protein QR680_012174 [Steinernema hermaphroditum]